MGWKTLALLKKAWSAPGKSCYLYTYNINEMMYDYQWDYPPRSKWSLFKQLYVTVQPLTIGKTDQVHFVVLSIRILQNDKFLNTCKFNKMFFSVY